MGLDLQHILNPEQVDMQTMGCNLCQKVMIKPVNCNGSQFCLSCIQGYLKENYNMDPVTGHHVSVSDIKECRPEVLAQQSHIKLHCPWCKAVLSLLEYQAHRSLCFY
jgi:phage FluMu protein Com